MYPSNTVGTNIAAEEELNVVVKRKTFYLLPCLFRSNDKEAAENLVILEWVFPIEMTKPCPNFFQIQFHFKNGAFLAIKNSSGGKNERRSLW